MAQPAYDLERFAPAKHTAPKPRLRLAGKQRGKTVRQQQLAAMAKTLLTVLLLVVLVSAVLNTQATLIELQGDIDGMGSELVEQEALNAYLSFELDNMTSLKNIEERAAEMGLQKADSSQLAYFRVEEATGIEVKENPLTRFFQNAKSSLLSILDFFTF